MIERLIDDAFPGIGLIRLNRQLVGGINSRVYHITTTKGDIVVKWFANAAGNKHDALLAETSFLSYANEICQEFVPRLLSVNTDVRLIAMEYIDGETIRPGSEVMPREIEAARQFLNILNIDHEKAHSVITNAASEGYLRLTDHLKNIGLRISRMQVKHLPKELRCEGTYLLGRCQDYFTNESDRIEKDLARGVYRDAISSEQLIVSPGDFGFHNVLRSGRGPIFIDFEHSGWDDPSKTAADFVLQPRVPVAKRIHESMRVLDGLSIRKPDYVRRLALFRLMELKWLCIVLNVLDDKRLAAMQCVHREIDLGNFIGERFRLARDILSYQS